MLYIRFKYFSCVKLIYFSSLKHQIKRFFFNISVNLNDGFHGFDNEPVDRFFFQKLIEISSTQRLLKVFKKLRANKNPEH